MQVIGGCLVDEDYNIFIDTKYQPPNNYGVIIVYKRKVVMTGLTEEQAIKEKDKLNKKVLDKHKVL